MSDSVPSSEADPLIGVVLQDRYRLVRKIGDGGMGAVYEGEHLLIGKRVAVKVLHAQLRDDDDAMGRFQIEARAASATGHPHIIEVTDLGTSDDGRPFMVLEYLEGRDWADELAASGPQPLGRTMHILEQACSALAAAHDKGIVHRDLKPANLFLTEFKGDPDFVKVLDFGISKMQVGDGDKALTKTGVALGTPYYMSPEQCQGRKDVDARSDIFALGVILFEALAGQRPFDADAYPTLVMKICTEAPPDIERWRLDVPPEIRALLTRMLSKARDDRPATCEEVRQILLPFVSYDAAPVSAERPPSADEVRSSEVESLTPAAPALPPTKASTNWPALGLAVLVGVLVAALAGLGWVGFARPPEPRAEAPTADEPTPPDDPGTDTSMQPILPRGDASTEASPGAIVEASPPPEEDAPQAGLDGEQGSTAPASTADVAAADEPARPARPRLARTRRVTCQQGERELVILRRGEIRLIGYSWVLNDPIREQLQSLRQRANAQIAQDLLQCYRGHAFFQSQNWLVRTEGAGQPFTYRPHRYCPIDPAVVSCVNRTLGEVTWPQPREDSPMEFRVSFGAYD